jgi:hypothetical protein
MQGPLIPVIPADGLVPPATDDRAAAGDRRTLAAGLAVPKGAEGVGAVEVIRGDRRKMTPRAHTRSRREGSHEARCFGRTPTIRQRRTGTAGVLA